MAGHQIYNRSFHTKLKPLYTTVLSSFLIFSFQQVMADTWNAATSNWFTDGNWLDNTAPTAADNVNIAGGTAQIGAAGAVSTQIILSNSGNISITAGGTLTSTAGGLSIALGNFNVGTMTVSGTGANWTASSNTDIVLGNTGSGNGTLNINSGGTTSLTATGTADIEVGSSGTGTITVDGTGSSLTISSQDEFVVSNPSSITISDAATVTSDTTLGLSGTLNIGNGAGAGVFDISEINGTGTTHILNFNHTDADHLFTKDGTTSGGAIVISGSTIVNKIGTGKTTLTGTNTYTGATTINGGTLIVNGSNSNSTTTVNAGGTLGGTGTVGSVNINGGSFAPGNSIGTTNVTGNVNFTGSGNYNVEVDAAGNSDKIIVTGSAVLTSGIVNVQPETGNYLLSTDYTILTATGGLGGTSFASVNSNFAFLTPTLTYDANNVFLNLKRNSVSFSSIADTANQTAIATVVANNATELQTITNNLLLLSASEAQQAFDSLSGVQHTHTQVLTNRLNLQFLQMLFNRSNQTADTLLAFTNAGFANDNFNPMQGYLLADNSDNWKKTITTTTKPANKNNHGWWLQGFAGFGNIDETPNVSNADYDSQGFAIGIDTKWHDIVIGIAGSYANTDVDTFGGNNNIDSFQLGTYANWQADDIFLSGAMSVGVHKTDGTRSVIIGTTTNTAAADYNSFQISTSLESGKVFSLTPTTTLTPYAGLSLNHSHRKGFSETGADNANLNIDNETENSLRTSLGLRLSHNIATDKYRGITPTVSIAYVREHLDNTSGMDAAFSAAPTNSFHVEGTVLDRNRVQMRLGITGHINDQTTLNIGYNGELASSDDNHSFNAMVHIVW